LDLVSFPFFPQRTPPSLSTSFYTPFSNPIREGSPHHYHIFLQCLGLCNSRELTIVFFSFFPLPLNSCTRVCFCGKKWSLFFFTSGKFVLLVKFFARLYLASFFFSWARPNWTFFAKNSFIVHPPFLSVVSFSPHYRHPLFPFKKFFSLFFTR